ncbi:aryl-sulfate sulfotransferase [uncultured Bifidobacterium sp.]|uniref:aryl-sulfate sulfotransferase n=1 Tax=uncultured Bifidobacterium sp. TaxID=165187 RepID=UPI00258DBCF3|nr:aryl-sulfate sulfotransferase [uncultured Bifidobacterium sp.]
MSRFTTRLHPRTLRWILAAIAVIVVALLCLLPQPNVTATVRQTRIERLNALVENVYTADFQQMRQEQLIAERDEEPRTIDNIYVKDDPYATNTRSLYVYFTTEQPATVSYTVTAEGYPDFSADAYEGVDEATTEHEFLVLGLLPDLTNTITLTITDETGDTTERVIEREGLGLLGTEEVRLEQPVQPAEGTDLGNGLYAILGNDSDDQDFMFYYDANGVLRGEVPILFYRSHRLLFDDDGLMWFSASTEKMAAMDRLGRLVKILDLGDRYILHHDYAFDADQNLVLLATELNRSDGCVQDQIVKLDTDTGKVTPLLDMGDMFPEYKMSTDHAGIDESDLSATGKWDWIHFNTIQMLPDGSALLSARETSTIIKIDDLEGTPTLDYMIGEPSVWAGTPQEDDFLTKVGDFPDTGGQHSVTYVDDPALPDGQYYLYMFDNNYGLAQTRPDFDWTVIDGIVTKYSIATEGAYSQYRRYLVDENAGTYTEVNAFDVPYSPLVSSAQELDGGRVLIDSGLQGLFGVYDESTGELLAQYRMKLNTSYIYRVYEYDFKGFYFA